MTPTRLTVIIIIATTLFSCNPANKDQHKGKFGIISCLEPETQGSEYYFESSGLKSGVVTKEKSTTELSAMLFSYQNGSYYGVDYNSEDIIRFGGQSGGLQETGRLHINKETTWRKTSSWFSWVDNQTLLIGSSMSGKHFEYCLINSQSMKLVSKGHLDIPLPPEGLNYGGIFGRLKGDKLYVSYTIYDYWNPSKPAPSDTTYLATIQFPSMKTELITKDARSTFPGGYLLSWEFGLIYKNDLYLVTQTGGRTREHPRAPNAVFRIKHDEQHFDPAYFFKLADKQKEEAYGLYDVGDGMAITKVIKKAAIGETMDYWNKNMVEYYLLDLVHQTRTKLALPQDILDFRRNILCIGNDIFIGIYDPIKKHTVIWAVNRHSLKTSPGLTVPGHVLQIFYINLD